MPETTAETMVVNIRGVDLAAARADPNVIYCGRANTRFSFPASPWASPFFAGQTWDQACRVSGDDVVATGAYETLDAAAAVRMHGYWVQTQPLLMNSLPYLKGKTLVCDCDPDGPCHARTLAALADATGGVPVPADERGGEES